jgi:hypothetical protein
MGILRRIWSHLCSCGAVGMLLGTLMRRCKYRRALLFSLGSTLSNLLGMPRWKGGTSGARKCSESSLDEPMLVTNAATSSLPWLALKL